MDRPTIKNTDLITICGMRGTGKTTWIRHNAKLFEGVGLLMFDPLNEFSKDFPCYVPETQNPDELSEVADYVFRKGNMLLIVSEAEIYLPNISYLPTGTFKLLTQGRHRNTGMWADSRRIANLNKTMFSLSEHCIVFRHFGYNDLKYLGEWIPDKTAISGLKDFHFIHYHRGTSTEYLPTPL